MSTSLRTIRRRRRYGTDFKRARVNDFESGSFSVSQLSRLYGVAETVIYRWIKKYSTLPQENAVVVEIPDSQMAKVKVLEDRIALLERALGNKQLALDLAVAKLALLAQQGIDVEKKVCSTKPLPKSVKSDQQ